MKRERALTAFLLSLLLTLSALGAQQPSLSGRVIEAASHQGIGGLTVNLEVSNAGGGRQLVTSTDRDGRFSFNNLGAGRYLLTVSQGVTQLHREEVDVNGNTTREISLQRR